jgi:hypothetical protein
MAQVRMHRVGVWSCLHYEESRLTWVYDGR